MMTFIYTVLLAAFAFEWLATFGRVAVMLLICVLLLATIWFLFHIHTSEEGFHMPWLQF